MAESRPMTEKLCVVTGATSGIGMATAQNLAGMGASVASRLWDVSADMVGLSHEVG